ncbi:MAG TPA: EAL domain-containing protein, partial [Solirubrobacteraceae bacterium]|nr:EAL domain-containing protein [Solirubrobacteraceae bacterium]
NTVLGRPDRASDGPPERWLERVHPDDLGPLRRAIDEHLEGRTPHFEHEHRIRHADGGWLWVLSRGVAIREPDGTPTRMAGSLSDVTQRHQAEARLIHDALHDALTGLPNRTLFLDRLEQALARSRRRPGMCCAILFADIDDFKLINDSHSHAVGDELLVALSQRLRAAVRPSDTVARLGGDEFTILLDDVTSSADAEQVAQRVLDALREPIRVEPYVFSVSASVGIAVDEGEMSPSELLRNADIAMYAAKKGRPTHPAHPGRSASFDTSMHARVVSRVSLESRLRKVAEQRRVAVHFQPIVEVATLAVVGLEALARWPDDDPEPVSPAEFVPLAEETGLIVELGRQVLARACVELAGWRARSLVDDRVRVHVNLSPRQLVDPGLEGEVRAVLASSGLPASRLRFELTETTLMSDPDRTRTRLNALLRLGVGLELDDFGTGHSSLTVLHHFPGDTIKIDRSFVNAISPGTPSYVIASSIVELARGLGMSVIAEGVEREEQVELLRGLGCQYAQGYLFSPPVPETAVGALLAGGRRTSPSYAC